MTVFMLSFTGVPLTLGFWGKFFLFRAAVQGGFTGLALIGLLTSLLSAYYYLRVVVVMFMQRRRAAGTPRTVAGPYHRSAGRAGSSAELCAQSAAAVGSRGRDKVKQSLAFTLCNGVR